MATMRVRRRAVAVIASLLAASTAFGFYLFYAPKPAVPDSPVAMHSLSIGGKARSYLIHGPTQPRDPVAVLLALHPSQSSAESMRAFVGRVLEPLADRSNVIVVYPNGYEGHFNDCRKEASYSARTERIDDVGFIRGIIEQLSTQYKIDRNKVFAMGYSNGGHMALRLALEAPDAVHGAASIAGNLPTLDNLDCKVEDKVASRIAFVNGTEDPINPYLGGKVTLFGFGNRGTVRSAQESAQWFAQRLNVATSTRTDISEGETPVAREDWQGEDAHVMLLSIEGGGHTVPQAGYRFPRIYGATWLNNKGLKAVWHLFFG